MPFAAKGSPYVNENNLLYIEKKTKNLRKIRLASNLHKNYMPRFWEREVGRKGVQRPRLGSCPHKIFDLELAWTRHRFHNFNNTSPTSQWPKPRTGNSANPTTRSPNTPSNPQSLSESPSPIPTPSPRNPTSKSSTPRQQSLSTRRTASSCSVTGTYPSRAHSSSI